MLGRRLGSFRLVRKLGKGGMGTVYLAEQTLIGSKVAVKVLHGDLASDPAAVARFHGEARAVNLIGHENIVSIFDMGVTEDVHYFVMEYLEGQSLTSLLQQGAMAAQVAIPILTQVCDALAAAHSRGVVHRDLKPDNIFLVKRGKDERFVKVLDFGVAKLLTADVGHTTHGMCVGTPAYMSPEQWLGYGVDGRADIYALGILAYRMAAGQLPFPRGGMLEMMTYHRERVPPTPRAVNPRVVEPWSNAIMRAIAKRPEERFQTADEFGNALREVLRDAQLPAPPRLEPLPAPPPAEPTPPTPAPALRARIFDLDGTELYQACCLDLSRGGVFICHDGPPPPLFRRLHLRLELTDHSLECLCEVVRHVNPREAHSWNMSPGFGVQFIEVSTTFRTSLSQLSKLVRGSTPAQLIAHYQGIPEGEHRRLLQIAPEAGPAEVRRVARRARDELSSLLAQQLPPEQKTRARWALERIDEAEQALIDETPGPHGARWGAPRGATVAIESGPPAPAGNLPDEPRDGVRGTTLHLDPAVRPVLGLPRIASPSGTARSATLLPTASPAPAVPRDEPTHEAVRGATVCLEPVPHPAGRPERDPSPATAIDPAAIHLSNGMALERAGEISLALHEYERGLAIDPLNLDLQQRYWSLHRRAQPSTRLAPARPQPRVRTA